MVWTDFIKKYIKYSAPIIGIISFLITFFNKEHSKYEENKEKYFDDFLVKFYNVYRSNNNINIRKFFNKNYSYVDTYIPGYINYLLEKKEYNKLKKVLVVDYFCYYPSVRNSISAVLHKIFDRAWFIQYCILFLSTMIMGFFTTSLIPMSIDEVIGRIKNTHYSSIGKIPAPIFMTVILFIMGLLTYVMKIIIDSAWIRNDMYTYDEKNIKKIITSKEKQYIKLKQRVYFL